MNEYDEALITQAVNNISPQMVDGGAKFRGPNATFDFIYQVWCEKALIQTRQLPAMLEQERITYLRQQKLMEEIGTKGKYTNTYGWSPTREFKLTFSLSRPTYHYFANVVGPFLGYNKEIWADGTRMYRYVKKLIMQGDKIRIAKFAASIERRIIKEQGKKIQGEISGIGKLDQGSDKETSSE